MFHNLIINILRVFKTVKLQVRGINIPHTEHTDLSTHLYIFTGPPELQTIPTQTSQLVYWLVYRKHI